MLQQFAQWDSSILLWVQDNLRHDILTPIWMFITKLGDVGWIWIALSLVLLLRKNTRIAGCFSASSLLLSFLVNNLLLKNLVARTRPYEVIPGLTRLIEAQKDYSFPSGHTASSFAVAVVLLLCLPKKLGIPAMVLAVLISFSRLYIGVHYLSDILAGAIISSMIAVFVWKIGMRLCHSTSIDKVV